MQKSNPKYKLLHPYYFFRKMLVQHHSDKRCHAAVIFLRSFLDLIFSCSDRGTTTWFFLCSSRLKNGFLPAIIHPPLLRLPERRPAPQIHPDCFPASLLNRPGSNPCTLLRHRSCNTFRNRHICSDSIPLRTSHNAET